MTRLQASATALSFIDEVTENVTPATPAWNRLRFTKENIQVKRNTVRTNELDDNRNVRDLIIASAESSGSFGVEFSYGAFDSIIESAMFSSWASNAIANGLILKPKSFQVKYEGPGTQDVFKRFRGCYVNELSFEMKPGEIVTGDVSIIGRTSEYSGAEVAGATYVAAPTDPVWTGNQVGSITLGSLAIDCVSMLSCSINNNLRLQRCLGSEHPSGVGYGDCEITGDIEFYLQNSQLPLLNAFLNNETLNLDWVMGNVANKKYAFDVDVKLSDAVVAAEGANQDVMIKAKWTGIERAATGDTLRITRAVA